MFTNMMMVVIAIPILFIIIGYSISCYNTLIAVKNNTKEAWSNIDVILKQRHDEIPKLITTCTDYMNHEKSIMENITKLRACYEKVNDTISLSDKINNEKNISRSLNSITGTFENYPKIKANKVFHTLLTRLSDLENLIADRREFYNDAANHCNTVIKQVPYCFFAVLAHAEPVPLISFSPEETKDVDVKSLFDQNNLGQ